MQITCKTFTIRITNFITVCAQNILKMLIKFGKNFALVHELDPKIKELSFLLIVFKKRFNNT